MRIVDISRVCREAKAVGAAVAVDNTFLSPALQTPLALGADLIIHSTTKYLNGHSDVVGGAVVAASPKDAEELTFWANVTGVTGSPFDAYQTLRGLRSLFPRVERQQRTAAAIADFLAAQKQVGAVYYPGLATHPGHKIARAQQRGFGAMLSFEITGGRKAIRRFVESLQVIMLAESLGGVETLIAHPASMTHVGMGPEARAVAGIKDELLRLSIGLESEDDLIGDLRQALDVAAKVN
jgi:cystathionine gamma-synthase